MAKDFIRGDLKKVPGVGIQAFERVDGNNVRTGSCLVTTAKLDRRHADGQ